MSDKSQLAFILIFISLAISIYFCINPKSLIPGGYELAIDGYVISRTLIIIFTLYLIAKIGEFLLKQKD
ncbi:hypothetical protein ACFWDG_14870 [Peribacillus sp. NPDC060186]